MSKTKTIYYCTNCGYESSKWLGKCSACNAWNSFTEEAVVKGTDVNEKENWNEYNGNEPRRTKSITLNEVIDAKEQRITSADAELNRVLGGGIVLGSLTLVAGEPGIGKSTLFLQNGLALKNLVVLYISGEESEATN
jgi:DNA repair protein RadA/Sms